MVLLLWVKGGKHYTISVPANSNNAYLMKNDEWSLQVNIKKTDSETGNQIAADAQYEIFQWDTVTGKYQPTGGYNTYSVQRQGDGTYAVINSAAYATTDSMRHTLYYTQRNAGKFIIVETKAPTGYFGDWTDINHPGMANTPLGKRGYYIEITEDSDNSVIWLDNADYNADIAATDKGGTKLVTSTGVETTVTIYDTAKDPRRTYNTDNSGKAANEDSYTITPTDGVMKNDRTLGEISISKVDLDAVRYVGGSTAHGTALASGQAHGDAALDGAVYDLYAAEDITHPDGVTGVVDYSKIVDADGNPIWHTTIRDNSGQWVSDYLPVLKKDHLVASAKIENGWLCFSNLYLGKYYVVERSTGVVIPLRDGALVVSSTYPTVDSRTKAATGQTAALAKNGSGQYTDWVYKNQFSTVSKGKVTGYLTQKHGFYYVVLNLPTDEKGKRNRKTLSTGLSTDRNATKAKALLQTMIRAASAGEEVHGVKERVAAAATEDTEESWNTPHPNMLFSNYLEFWLQWKRKSWEEVTYSGYCQNVRSWIAPYFSARKVRLNEITVLDIEMFYTHEINKRGVSGNTVLHYHANIRKALSDAVKLKLIPYNPAAEVERPKKDNFVASYYSADELMEVLPIFANTKMELPVMLAAFYGLRRSEVIGLQWSAIDFERKIVTISRTFERINVDGKMVDVSKCRTKNKSSFRSLPLIPAVEQALLKAQKRQRQQMKLCGNSYCKEYKDYICVDDMGHLVTPDYVTRVFREMLLKNGFRPIRYHDLRHSCASLLIKNKVTMKEVQMWLGHSSFSTTANIYAHIDVDSKMEAANMIASKINLGELPEKKKSPKRKIA